MWDYRLKCATTGQEGKKKNTAKVHDHSRGVNGADSVIFYGALISINLLADRPHCSGVYIK